jgi:hypothetical protein
MFIQIVQMLFAMVYMVSIIMHHVTSIQDYLLSPTPSGGLIYPPELVMDDAASTATVETLAYSGDGNDDAWSACGTEAGEE